MLYRKTKSSELIFTTYNQIVISLSAQSLYLLATKIKEVRSSVHRSIPHPIYLDFREPIYSSRDIGLSSPLTDVIVSRKQESTRHKYVKVRTS